MQRTITFPVRLVTIIAIVVYYGSCYCAAEDRPLNRSLLIPQIVSNTGEGNESMITPPLNVKKKDESSLATPPRNTNKKDEWSAAPPQNGTANKQPRVPKCCADGQVFRYRINIEDIECVPQFDNGTYSFADRLKRLLIFSPETNESSSFVGIEYGKRCRGYDFLIQPNDTFTLLNGGSRVDFQTDTVNGSTADFCIEFIANENRLVPLLCPITVIEHHQVHPLYPITLSISALFMLATVFVLYSVDKLKTLYGKLLLCHATSLTIGYLFLIPTQIFHFYDTCKPFCFVTAIGVQFFFLAGFCWLSVISYDMWLSFSYKRVVHYELRIRIHREQFIRYSAYAWGCPVIITSITLLAEFWPKMSEVFPYPNLADKSCGFGNKLSSGYYFYVPIGIVLVLNGVICCAVLKIYIKISRSLRKLENNSETTGQPHVQQSRVPVCVKLLIVMGVWWIMEVISWLAGGPEYTWYATYICNSMQGVAIFFITICSNQPRRLLRQKISMIRLKAIRRSTTSRQATVSELNVT